MASLAKPQTTSTLCYWFLNKAINKNKYTQMAQGFCSSARRENGRIASYVTIFTTRQMGKKTSQLGMFILVNRLS